MSSKYLIVLDILSGVSKSSILTPVFLSMLLKDTNTELRNQINLIKAVKNGKKNVIR